MKAYLYYTSTTRADVERCHELVTKANGGTPIVGVVESVVPAYPGLFGMPVGAGSEAPSGNPGVEAIQALRVRVAADEVPELTAGERDELLAQMNVGVELEDDWYWNDGT